MCECGDPHASNTYECHKCRGSGKITVLDGLSEAVSISDPSALEFILREQQCQNDLDCALGSATRSKHLEHVRLLLEAGADVQAGLSECVRDALHCHWRLTPPTKEQVSILRLLVESGATVGDKEMQCLDDAFECVERNASQETTKEALEVFADILMSAGAKVLSLCVDRICSHSWIINVYSWGGDCIATFDAVPSSMTLGELQVEIQSQASIPCARQSLICGGERIDVRSVRSRYIGELLR